jgi:hypothetical protein
MEDLLQEARGELGMHGRRWACMRRRWHAWEGVGMHGIDQVFGWSHPPKNEPILKNLFVEALWGVGIRFKSS